MTAFIKVSSTVSFVLLTTGCAHDFKTSYYRNVLSAAAGGAVVGFLQPQRKVGNAVLLGGASAIAAGLLTIYLGDPEKDLEKMKRQSEALKRDLDEIEAPKLQAASPGTLSGHVPTKYKGLVNPGEWRVYGIDQWVEDDDNRMIHQDQIMELTPPSLIPRTGSLRKKPNPKEKHNEGKENEN